MINLVSDHTFKTLDNQSQNMTFLPIFAYFIWLWLYNVIEKVIFFFLNLALVNKKLSKHIEHIGMLDHPSLLAAFFYKEQIKLVKFGCLQPSL